MAMISHINGLYFFKSLPSNLYFFVYVYINVLTLFKAKPSRPFSFHTLCPPFCSSYSLLMLSSQLESGSVNYTPPRTTSWTLDIETSSSLSSFSRARACHLCTCFCVADFVPQHKYISHLCNSCPES